MWRHAHRPPAAEATLLIVDDTPENVDILAGVLQDSYAIRVALDGPRALKIAADAKPDLILLDVMMPGMDGYEVCRKLQENPATQDIPIIFVTAKTEVADETNGLELGAVDYLAKPISPPIVLARVRTQLALRRSRKNLEDLSDQLSRYLSPQLYKSIFEGRSRAQIQTARKKLTVCFSDIVGFTAQTEGMEPEDMSMVLNEYLNRMAAITLRHGGTLDKFIGDAVLAFFGDPESQGVENDAIAAVRMALEMRLAVEELNADWRRRGIALALRIRIGLSTGYCTVGNFGSDQRMDYTIIGGQVNLASRLESAAKPGEILIAEETWSLVQNHFHCRAVEPITAKGFREPVAAWQVLGEGNGAENGGEVLRVERDGFRLELDPGKLDAEARREVLARLQAAVSRIV